MNIPWQNYSEYSPEEKLWIERARAFLIPCVLAAIICLTSSCNSDPVYAEVVDLNTIRTIESSGNPFAVSKTGAVGLYQIMPCVLQEYNSFNKTNYSRADLFNPKINETIARWYLIKRIPQMLKHYGKAITTTNCIIAYNAGVRAVIKGYTPKETKNYLAKYQRLARAK